MRLDRFAPILAFGLCSRPEQASLEALDSPKPVASQQSVIAPDPSLKQALEKIHREATGPHCGFTASALEEARFVQTPEGVRIQMGSRVFELLRWSGAETAILQSISTKERSDVKCLEVDGVPENDIGWNDCGDL